VTTSTGETVDVRVSDALPLDTSTPEGWAEFLTRLTHGPEITLLTTYIASLEEADPAAGARLLFPIIGGVGTTIPDVSPEEIVVTSTVITSRYRPIPVGAMIGAEGVGSADGVGPRARRFGDDETNYARILVSSRRSIASWMSKQHHDGDSLIIARAPDEAACRRPATRSSRSGVRPRLLVPGAMRKDCGFSADRARRICGASLYLTALIRNALVVDRHTVIRRAPGSAKVQRALRVGVRQRRPFVRGTQKGTRRSDSRGGDPATRVVVATALAV
jgi:hypothetical protein